MKDIHYSSKAKKDIKRYRHKVSLMKALYDVLQYLTNEEDVPKRYYFTLIHSLCSIAVKV